MFKKLVAIAMASTMTAAMAITSFAASGLNDQETKIINALREAGVPESQINKVEKQFITDGVDITAAEAENALKSITAAKEIVEKQGITNVSDLLKDENKQYLDEVVAEANKAADAVGYTGDISVSADGKVVSTTTDGSEPGIPTTSTTPVVDNSTPNSNNASLKTTGADFSTTAAVVAGLGLSVAGVAIASKKRISVNA